MGKEKGKALKGPPGLSWLDTWRPRTTSGSRMWPERRRDASSDDAASSSSSSEAADRMELEAAEALAVLAHSAGMRSDSGGKWGGKGKRGKSKRVKSESPSDNPLVDSVPDPPLQDRGVETGDRGGPTGCTDVLPYLANAEPEAELPKPSPGCTKSHHGVGVGRSRQNLTEEEKEARRLRRVLANRESARQTIRRRQAVCEELTKKATDLAWENENLKREKELALKEHHSLESLNKCLKAQMAKACKFEMEEARELKLVCEDKLSTQRTHGHTLVKDRQPFSPLCWPAVVQSANVQSRNGLQNAVLIPSNIPMPPDGKFESSWQLQENALQVNGPRAPLYLVPCPWFFPVPEHGNEFLPQPSVKMNHMQDTNSVSNNVCEEAAPSNGPSPTENLFPLQVKLEATIPGEIKLMTDLNEAPLECPPEEDSDEWLVTSLALSSVTPATPIKHELSSQSEHNPGKDNPIRASQMGNDFAHRNLRQCDFRGKQLVNAAAAAEARRRRMELTRLKNLHGRQCKTSC